MKRFFKAILPIFVLTPLFVGGCSSDESLELLKFEHVSSEEMPSKKEERVNKLDDDVTVLDDETFNLKATVKNNNRDSFIDLVIYISDTDKTVVYNEGNGTYQCSSVTEYIDNLWVTNIYLTYSVTQINGYLEVKEVSFLHGSNENKKATINDSSVKAAKYHKHDFINEVVVEAPTDYEPGKGTHTCSDCGIEAEYVIQPNYTKYTNEFTYELTTDQSGYRVTSVLSDLEEYVIPNEYEGKPVVELAELLFAPYESGGIKVNRQLKKVILPNTLKAFSTNCFYGCSKLESLVIPDSLENLIISFYSVSTLTSLHYNEYNNGCYLGSPTNPYMIFVKAKSTDITSCVIHKDTKFIDSHGFSYCENLETISFPEGIKFPSLRVFLLPFYLCNSLRYIDFPEGSVQFIEGIAVTNGALEYIVLPVSATRIQEDAVPPSCDYFNTVYYRGTPSQAAQISKGTSDKIANATWYYFTSNGASETSTGKWWYYASDNVTIIEKVVA